MATHADQILLQGTEMSYAWSIALNTGGGRLAATPADHGRVIALFSGCTA